MIFLTVGTQLPFDRLVKAVDEWGESQELEIIAQIGNSKYKPMNMKYKSFFDPQEMRELFNRTDLIVSHAGMGTIISALQKKKPILVMPREVAYDEHRNDHQLATAKSFFLKGYIKVAFSSDELKSQLDDNIIAYPGYIGDFASESLLSYISEFIRN